MKLIITIDEKRLQLLMARAWNTRYGENLPVSDFNAKSCNAEDIYNAFQSDLSNAKVEDFEKLEAK